MAMPDQVPDVGAAKSRVPPPVGAWVYPIEASPENTSVSAEPFVVLKVWPLVSNCPFSITKTAPDGASIVTSPVSCRSPQTCTLPLKLLLPDHLLEAGRSGS